jgi:NAD(P)-dependent dehydrogenase (short-subunit alcohol dehydrogenase family)
MNMNKRSVGWSGALVGLAGLTMVVARRYRRFDAPSLRGKVALITGSSRGLGLAIALELASKGARLVLTSRHLDELERAKARLLATGKITPENVFVLSADVSVVSDIRRLVAAATAHFGQIDVVVNNAGIILVGPVESQTLANYQQAMDTNFSGALHTTLAVLPQMLARGDGAIVNIASIGARSLFPISSPMSLASLP